MTNRLFLRIAIAVITLLAAVPAETVRQRRRGQ